MGYSPYITLLSVLFILTAFTLVQAFIVDQLADMLLASLFIFSTHARDRFEQVLYSRPCARYPLDTCCCCSVAQSCQTLTPWTAAQQASLSFTISQSLLKLNVHWVGDAIQPFCLLSSPLLLPSNHSQHQGLFQWVSSFHQVAKVLDIQHQPTNEYSRLISFRINWFDLLVVQGTLSRVFSRIKIQRRQFFSVPPSLWSNSHIHTWHDYWKTIALTFVKRAKDLWTFVGKVMSLLFNTLARFVILSLQRNKCLLILWL